MKTLNLLYSKASNISDQKYFTRVKFGSDFSDNKILDLFAFLTIFSLDLVYLFWFRFVSSNPGIWLSCKFYLLICVFTIYKNTNSRQKKSFSYLRNEKSEKISRTIFIGNAISLVDLYQHRVGNFLCCCCSPHLKWKLLQIFLTNILHHI